jgi:hypothetical protein
VERIDLDDEAERAEIHRIEEMFDMLQRDPAEYWDCMAATDDPIGSCKWMAELRHNLWWRETRRPQASRV